ncbi:MAG: copper chaperone PCu(A)C [Anaerolineae bacterium]|nr:copper chaperone PCu(A)C [Anaerolineae bacterium]
MRVAHLSPTAPAVDIYVNGEMAIGALSYKSVTDYMALEGFEFAVQIVPAGGTLADAVTPEPIMVTFEGAGYYTVAAVGLLEDGTFELLVLPHDGEMAHDMEAKEEGTGSAGSIMVTGAYARATAREMEMGAMPEATAEAGGMGGMEGGHGMSMGDVSAAYMLISNTGSEPEVLVGVASDVSDMTQLHQTTVQDGMARMGEIEELEIPAGGSVELMPGGYHVMMMELKHPLLPGEYVTITLTFASGLELTMTVPVKEVVMP